MPIKAIRKFIKLEASGGIILFTAALIAFILSNSPYALEYQKLFNTPLSWQWGQTLSWWINDALMVLFFLMVCLEIKWEIFKGELNSTSKRILPLIAALGGMLVPALIYMLFNRNTPSVYSGWAIPTATDIAFSLGILVLLGKRVPLSLKVLLSAIAIFDDLGAIIIIAFFYTEQISLWALSLAILTLVILYILNGLKTTKISPYLIVGFFLWLFLLKSGIHPTLAGVATAFAIPIESGTDHHSPAMKTSAKLHPWVSFLILPLFALANAGVSLATGLTLAEASGSLALGIAAGLFLGKQIGIFSSIFLAVKLKLCSLPGDLRWSSLYGMALICGIGFTMSLFIGSLAFDANSTENYTAIVRWGVILGSFCSGIAGYFYLYFHHRPQKAVQTSM